MLHQVYHLFMSQKSESLHQQITRVAPKDKHFSSSMALSDRVALVVVLDSVGYECALCMIVEEIQIELSPITVQYLRCRDQTREYWKSYKKQLPVVNRRYALRKGNIRKHLQDKAAAAENGMDYGPSIAVETDACVDIEVEGSNPDKCNDCGRPGHKTKRSGSCWKNPNLLSMLMQAEHMSPNTVIQSNDPNCCCDCGRPGHKTKRNGNCWQNPTFLAMLGKFCTGCMYVHTLHFVFLKNLLIYGFSN